MLLITVSMLIMVGIILLDQISKYAVVANIALGESVDVIRGVFRFTYIRNEGAAFGMLDDARWVFLLLSTLAIVGVLVYMFVKKPTSRMLCISLAFIVGGGVGNMIDRIKLGYVIDFLDFCAFPKLWMWTFNVADAFVVVGAFMLIVWMIIDMVGEYKREKSGADSSANDSECAGDIDTDVNTDVDADMDCDISDDTDKADVSDEVKDQDGADNCGDENE